MAALVCIAYSVGVHCFRAGRVFCDTGGSIFATINYLQAVRNEILNQEYLQHLDRIYEHREQQLQFDARKRSANRVATMEADEVIRDDFIAIERAVEATENGLRSVSSEILRVSFQTHHFFIFHVCVCHQN